MGRRSSKSEEPSGAPVVNASLSCILRDRAIKTLGGSTYIKDKDVFLDSIYGIPLLRNLPLQYMFGVDVLALERLMSLVGPPGSTKSSFGWYLVKLFLENGGIVFFIDTEHKTNPDQVRAIINNDALMENIIYMEADSLDLMLSQMIKSVKLYEEYNPERNVPVMLLVDSLNGVTSLDVIESTMSGESAAGMSGARNAGSIQQNLQVFGPQLLSKNPMIAVITNHQGEAVNVGAANPFAPKPKTDPGGKHKNFAYTWKLELARMDTKKDIGHCTPIIKMKIIKSSLGETRGYPLVVPYRSIFDEEGRETIFYDWNTSLIDLLLSKAVSQRSLAEYLDIRKTGSKYSSDRLKLKDVSAYALGDAIHSDAALVSDLQKHVLRIRCKRKFGNPILETSQNENKNKCDISDEDLGITIGGAGQEEQSSPSVQDEE